MSGSKKAYRFGMLAEHIAAFGLCLRGYKILARRYKTPVGEIDLIAQRKNVLAFVEVKARADIDSALQALTPRMQERIGRAAGYFIMQNNHFTAYTIRFDLIALAPPFFWKHLDNAWHPSA